MKKKIDNLNNLFEKSLKEIESKMKELFLNEIKIKENVKTIKNLENKNIYLDNAIKDKKTELNILKQLTLIVLVLLLCLLYLLFPFFYI